MPAREINFDGLVGPTYYFGGLSFGNIASMKHKKVLSSPKNAALEGLKKMKFLMDLGLLQGIIPPQERPNLSLLRKLGFQNSPEKFLKEIAETPSLLEALSSSSSIWAANAATVIPSCDSADKKVHFITANLLNRFHRSIESEETYRVLNHIFSDPTYFVVHSPLPKGGNFGDEGAANHCRFRKKDGEKGVHLFVYGKSAFEESVEFIYPARQAKEASEAVARLGKLEKETCVFAKQNPELINLGVFHNDVISTSHLMTFLYHEKAFSHTSEVIKELEEKTKKICRSQFVGFQVTEEMLSVKNAIESYFFNSQIVTLKDGKTLFIAPEECRSLDLSWLPFPISYINVRQSMKNGGGPACLRLRVELTDEEIQKVHPFSLLNDSLYQKLVDWVEKYYREELRFEDLSDPSLFRETHEALEALTKILQLGSFYSFQKERQ